MVKNQPAKSLFFIGIDGGGSKCRATIYSAEDNVMGTGVSGRANPLHGLSQTFESIQLSTELALKDAGMSLTDCKYLVAGLGLAGVNVARLYQDVVNWQHPFADMYVTSDLHTACIGAHKGGDGAVIITGTGSCGYANVEGKDISLGGHGFALGDKGSGGWLGLKAAEQSLLHLDGFIEQTTLTRRLCDHLKVNNALGIVESLAGESSSVYAKLARIVLECANQQDQASQIIVKEGAAYISELARKLFKINPPRFSMIGGLAEPLIPWLDKDVIARLSPALAPPELGATYFARAQFARKVSQ
ncbi:ATPase [Shewanella sp. VB17]|nr:BadF/BadG/BcrA/BcrD ATPase family protein [Shewanella sp. VB17]NRD72819.1 ATPase [Shewanella sp. VB17]